MNILGLNAFHGDSSAAVFSDGLLVAALEEERLNRIKHWAGMPLRAAAECLKMAGGELPRHVGVSRDPRVNAWRKLVRAASSPMSWSRLANRAKNQSRFFSLGECLRSAHLASATTQVHMIEHHRTHMASAFFASPFDEAAIVSVDGFGDFSSFMWGTGRNNSMRVRGAVHFPHSLGMFYTAFTQFLGFMKYGDEYKMMGLAAYGKPRYAHLVRDVVRVHGTDCRLNLAYFTHHNRGVDMTWDDGEPALAPIYSQKMCEVFGAPRVQKSEINERYSDLAASVQLVLEECYFALLNAVHSLTGAKNLCLAGGVALNCAANGKLFERTSFENIYVQPAAHDAGTSIGAALYVQHQVLGQPRSFEMRHVYYGPEYSDADMAKELKTLGVVYERLNHQDLVNRIANEIALGKIVGWFQGRMEFGPRALGNRSILADPRRELMKDVLNQRIKYREPFRPFCPSILAETTAEYFEINQPSPFMVMAFPIKPRHRNHIPAVTHMDGTGRLQTVEKEANPLYWKLIHRFSEITGVPVLLNTSFNENEPIVNTPKEALECFLRTRMDVLALGHSVITKAENLKLTEHRTAFARTGAV
jgi:carbamoyltransferase